MDDASSPIDPNHIYAVHKAGGIYCIHVQYRAAPPPPPSSMGGTPEVLPPKPPPHRKFYFKPPPEQLPQPPILFKRPPSSSTISPSSKSVAVRTHAMTSSTQTSPPVASRMFVSTTNSSTQIVLPFLPLVYSSLLVAPRPYPAIAHRWRLLGVSTCCHCRSTTPSPRNATSPATSPTATSLVSLHATRPLYQEPQAFPPLPPTVRALGMACV